VLEGFVCGVEEEDTRVSRLDLLRLALLQAAILRGQALDLFVFRLHLCPIS
jgi:hypothetical protein